MILRILYLEDDPLQVELVTKRLAAEGITCEVERVDNRPDFAAALER
jgi:hypothetical protein